jgi:hypothetical protein
MSGQKTCVTSSPSDEELEEMRRRRFEERVQRVLEVMRQERVDWRGAPFIGPDGRILVRILPVEAEGT